MGRDYSPFSAVQLDAYFNPRARVGRDKSGDTWDLIAYISIHAPAWGATLVQKAHGREFIISIHAPAWGATEIRKVTHAPTRDFNPRARVGRDHYSVNYELDEDDFNPRARVGRDACRRARREINVISIHAPAWGATGRTGVWRRVQLFQSTRPRGARRRAGLGASRATEFQSTRPRGARRRRADDLFGGTDFNPRARVGRDFYADTAFLSYLHFNPRARVGRDWSRRFL